MNQPWTRKYRPVKKKDLIGQDSVIEQLERFILKHTSKSRKGLLIYGGPGTGKTSSVYAVAGELNLEILEVNASDFRNRERIDSIVGGAVRQRSLFAKGKVILVDEIDGLSGNSDRGGISALTTLIKISSYPIIMTANDPFDKKFSDLRRTSVLVAMNTPTYLSIASLLARICHAEKIKADESSLKSLARRAGGDVRAAINDLQSLAEGGKISQESVDGLSDREKKESLYNALIRVFKSTDALVAKKALADINEPWNEFMMWIDENLPAEYQDVEDLARAYEALSRADVFSGRIRRMQHYRFLVYINDLISAGVALAKTEKYQGMVKYKRPARLLSLYIAKMRFAKRNSIAEKLARHTHTSKRVAIWQVPYLAQMTKNKEMAKRLSHELELSKEELEWLKAR